MKTTIANKSWFHDSDLRLDASYHLSETIQVKHHFKHSPYNFTALSQQASDVFSGNIFKRIYVKDETRGLPYLTGSDIIKADLVSGKYISNKQAHDLQRLILKEGWILVTCSGTLGNVVYTNKLFEGRLATHDLIRIIPQNNDIKPGFLYAYLASRYGYVLLTQSSYGGVVKHIEPHHIENIPIPIFPPEKQQQIHDLIIQSAALRVEANRLLEEAISVFEMEIGATNINLGKQYEAIKIESVKSFMSRLDSQFQVASKKLKIERKPNFVYRKISSLAKNINVGNRSKRIYVNNGIPFLSSSDMVLFNPKKYAKQISTRSANLDSVKVSLNDILISRSGTVGNVVIVGNDLENSAVSEHALRLVINSSLIAPEYVFCYLKTKQGKLTMEASAFGSVIITLNEDLIGNIEVPILDELTMKEIISKVQLFVNKMDLATAEEAQAIQLVEKEIDQWQN